MKVKGAINYKIYLSSTYNARECNKSATPREVR